MKLLKLYEQALTDGVTGKHLVVVDIQPEYRDGFDNMGMELAQFINENIGHLNRLTFLYNGADTLGMIELGEYQNWWYDQGLDEDIAFNAEYYDKGYAFFRYCMDEGIDEEQIIHLIKHMMDNDVNDSRDLEVEFWNSFIERYGAEDIRELVEFSDDCVNIPDLMDELRNYGNILICGGAINECLKEVEIALNALGKPYSKLDEYTY
jgi:hypothetical protein